MSKMLNLADCILARGRNLHELGRDADALRVFSRLAGWPALPRQAAEETQARLAEICLRYGQYSQARRHLSAVLEYRPDSARYHYLLATAYDHDETGDTQAAYEHYRQSLRLDPNQSDCLADFGLLALRLEQEEEGLRALRRAVELAPDNACVVGKLIEGLHDCGQHDEVRLTLQAALFRNPRSYAFQKLWSDFRFRQACKAQQTARHGGQAGQEMEQPTLLPFLHLVPDGMLKARDRKRFRRNAASFAFPHSPRSARVSDQKHA